MRPGDFALERDKGFVGWGIRLFTRSRWNHAKLIVDESGKTLEALASGAVYDKVLPTDIVVEAPLSDSQRAGIPDIAWLLEGRPYAYLDIVALALAQFGIRPKWARRRLMNEDQLFCSQLVDYAWELAGFKAFADGRIPGDVTPGDLADLAFVDWWPVLQHPAEYDITS